MGVLTFSSGFWEAAPLWCVTGIVLGWICFGLQGKEHFWIGQLPAYVRPDVRMFHVNYVPRDQFFCWIAKVWSYRIREWPEWSCSSCGWDLGLWYWTLIGFWMLFLAFDGVNYITFLEQTWQSWQFSPYIRDMNKNCKIILLFFVHT